jgi:hypothetical protein
MDKPIQLETGVLHTSGEVFEDHFTQWFENEFPLYCNEEHYDFYSALPEGNPYVYQSKDGGTCHIIVNRDALLRKRYHEHMVRFGESFIEARNFLDDGYCINYGFVIGRLNDDYKGDLTLGDCGEEYGAMFDFVILEDSKNLLERKEGKHSVTSICLHEITHRTRRVLGLDTPGHAFIELPTALEECSYDYPQTKEDQQSRPGKKYDRGFKAASYIFWKELNKHLETPLRSPKEISNLYDEDGNPTKDLQKILPDVQEGIADLILNEPLNNLITHASKARNSCYRTQIKTKIQGLLPRPLRQLIKS